MLVHLPREEAIRYKETRKSGSHLADRGAITMKDDLADTVSSPPA